MYLNFVSKTMITRFNIYFVFWKVKGIVSVFVFIIRLNRYINFICKKNKDNFIIDY